MKLGSFIAIRPPSFSYFCQSLIWLYCLFDPPERVERRGIHDRPRIVRDHPCGMKLMGPLFQLDFIVDENIDLIKIQFAPFLCSLVLLFLH